MGAPSYKNLDQLICAGKFEKVQQWLSRLDTKRVKREEILELSKIARRASLPDISLNLLQPLVRGGKPGTEIASNEEKVEYAQALSLVGAQEEAELLISPIEEKSPALLFCQASILVSQWRYQEAIPFWQEYLTLTTGYAQSVGAANLAAALVETNQLKEAKTLLDELVPDLKKTSSALLLSNAHELLAEICLKTSNLLEGQNHLNEAKEILKNQQNWDTIHLDKLEHFYELLRNKSDANCLRLAQLRVRATKASLWETVRDCDRFESTITENKEMFIKLLFGTPFLEFRKNALANWKQDIELPETYKWVIKEAEQASHIDLTNGEILGANSKISLGKMNHNLLAALSSDFYRPCGLATLFYRLYPGEHYNPQNASVRVHQCISRLRKWLNAQKIPVEIKFQAGHYQLVAEKGLTIEVAKSKSNGTNSWFISRLWHRFGKCYFRVRDVVSLFDVSPKVARKFLSESCKSKVIVRVGEGRNTAYRFEEVQDL